MADTLLCIDIQESYVTSLVVEKNAKTRIVNGCGFVLRTDSTLEEALSEVVTQTGYVGGSCIVTLGAELFTYRNISLPFSSKKHLEQILPYELEQCSALDINQLIVDWNIGIARPEETEVSVAMIPKEVLSGYIAALERAGLNPEKIGISGFAIGSLSLPDSSTERIIIDFADGWATLFIVVNGSVCLVRSIPAPSQDVSGPDSDSSFLFNLKQILLYLEKEEIQKDDLDLYLCGSLSSCDSIVSNLSVLFQKDRIHSLACSTLPLVKINSAIRSNYRPEVMDRVLASTLKGKRQSNEFNFRKNEFMARKSAAHFIRLGTKFVIPFFLLILIASSYLVYDFRQLKYKQKNLDSQIRKIFTTTLPDITRIVNPLHQMQIVINDIQKSYRPGGEGAGSYSVVTILTELSVRVPEKYPFKIVKMVVEKEAIRIKAETGDFNIVDNIKKELSKSAMFSNVVISSANQSSQADKITCELKILLAE